MTSYGSILTVRAVSPDAAAATDDRIQYLLDRASTIVLHEVPGLTDRLAAEDNLLGLLEGVITDMVLRVLRNPDGARSRSSTKGPFTESVTFADTGPVDLAMTDFERAQLAPTSTPSTARRRLGSYRVRPGSL